VSIDPNSLERLNRDELIAKARQLGAQRAELLTRPELRDEIIRLSSSDEDDRRRARGWFGVARDLVASVVSQGLNLPDTAELIRGANVFAPRAAPPVATVTLAEIYAAQGHVTKALDLLDEVLAKEPDHEAAQRARNRWAQSSVTSERSAGCESAIEQESHGDVDAADPAQCDGASEYSIAGDPNTSDPDHSGAAMLPRAVADVAANPADTAEQAAIDVVEVAQSAPLPVRPPDPVDERLVALRGADGTLLCEWELVPKTLEKIRDAEPTGILTLRVSEVVASWDGPVTRQQEVEISELRGSCRVSPHVASSEVRLAVGWRTAEHFRVLTLGAEFAGAEGGADEADGPALRWAPPHSMAPEHWRCLGRAAARRLHGAA